MASRDLRKATVISTTEDPGVRARGHLGCPFTTTGGPGISGFGDMPLESEPRWPSKSGISIAHNAPSRESSHILR